MNIAEFGRKLYRKQSILPSLLLTLAALILLSGCGVNLQLSFSPDAAITQQILNSPMPNMQVKADSIRILQKQPVGNTTLVLVSFQGFQPDTGESKCLFTYEVFRQGIGTWTMGGGGGSCQSAQNPDDQSPISVGGGSGSGGRHGSPGYSTVSGEVFQEDIRSVIVTWQDDTTQTAEVINNSFLIGRTGQMAYKKVEALNEKKEIVFTSEIQVAPEKQQQEMERELSEPTKDANP